MVFSVEDGNIVQWLSIYVLVFRPRLIIISSCFELGAENALAKASIHAKELGVQSANLSRSRIRCSSNRLYSRKAYSLTTCKSNFDILGFSSFLQHTIPPKGRAYRNMRAMESRIKPRK